MKSTNPFGKQGPRIMFDEDGEVRQVAGFVYSHDVDVRNSQVRMLRQQVLNVISLGILSLLELSINLASNNVIEFQLRKYFHL